MTPQNINADESPREKTASDKQQKSRDGEQKPKIPGHHQSEPQIDPEAEDQPETYELQKPERNS